MGRGLNSARLRRQKRRLRPRVQKYRQQPEVSGRQRGSSHYPTARGQPLLSDLETSLYCSPSTCLLSLCMSLFLPDSSSTFAFVPVSHPLMPWVSVSPSWSLSVCSSVISSSVSDTLSRPPQRLQQENHELRQSLAARGAEWEARAVELEGDVEALRAQLGEQRSEQQDSGRERARALSELSEQNLRLSQQLAQVRQP